MASEHNTGSKDTFGDDSVTLEDAIRISDELLSRPTALQDAEEFFASLQISSPSLFKMIADAAQELSAMPGARYLQFPSSPSRVDADRTAAQTSLDSAINPILVSDTNGTLWYKCTHCGRQYARQGRARDCRNAAFNIKPYNCTGQCGDASWLVQSVSSSGDYNADYVRIFQYEIIRYQGALTPPPEGRKGQLLEMWRTRLEAESPQAHEILHEGRVKGGTISVTKHQVHARWRVWAGEDRRLNKDTQTSPATYVDPVPRLCDPMPLLC